MKKGFGFWALFLVVGAALICMCFFSIKASTSIIPGSSLPHHENGMVLTISSRKLKENIHAQSSHKSNAHNVNLEDYHPIDPVPSSKASIRPGPIQHGTPLMPYIPKPTPPGPGHPKHAGFP